MWRIYGSLVTFGILVRATSVHLLSARAGDVILPLPCSRVSSHASGFSRPTPSHYPQALLCAYTTLLIVLAQVTVHAPLSLMFSLRLTSLTVLPKLFKIYYSRYSPKTIVAMPTINLSLLHKSPVSSTLSTPHKSSLRSPQV